MTIDPQEILAQVEQIIAEAEGQIKDIRRKARIKAIKRAGEFRDRCEQELASLAQALGLDPNAFTEAMNETLDALEETLTNVLTDLLIQKLVEEKGSAEVQE